MGKAMMTKPLLVAGAIAVRRKILQNQTRRRRRRILGLTSGLVVLASGAAAAYRIWTKRNGSQIDAQRSSMDQEQPERRSIKLDAKDRVPSSKQTP